MNNETTSGENFADYSYGNYESSHTPELADHSEADVSDEMLFETNSYRSKICKSAISLTNPKDIINCAIHQGHSTEEAVVIANAKIAYTKRVEKFKKSYKYA